MTWAFTRKTASAIAPIEHDVFRLHLRLTDDASGRDESSVVETYINAATAWVEDYTGRALLTQTWQMSLSDFPLTWWLPYAAPLGAVTFIKYYDTSNVLQTLSSSVYTVPSFTEPAQVRLADGQSWPSVYARDDAVLVEYTAGATSPSLIPAPLRQAVQMLAAYWYEQRETAIVGISAENVPLGAEALCGPLRLKTRPPEWRC